MNITSNPFSQDRLAYSIAEASILTGIGRNPSQCVQSATVLSRCN